MARYSIVEKNVEYIPKWDGNREKDEPIKFTLRYLNNSERAKCYAVKADSKGETYIEPDNDLLIKYGVIGIENLEVENEGGEVRNVKNAIEFRNVRGFPELYLEVATQVLIMNSRQDLGN